MRVYTVLQLWVCMIGPGGAVEGGGGHQWVAILSDFKQLLLVVSQPCGFAIETFLAQGQVCAVSWGVFTFTGKYLHLNDLFPI